MPKYRKSYLETTEPEATEPPGLMILECSEAAKAEMVAAMESRGQIVKEVNKSRAIEIVTLQNKADGMTEEEARAAAIEDVEECV